MQILASFLAALGLAIVSTLGDFIWAHWNVRHRMINGLVHGAAICLCIGAAIGIREKRVLAGVAAGPVIGLLAAAGFYLLAGWLGLYAMFPMWMFFWLCFALLQSWLARDGAYHEAAARGIVAALGSGVAFYAISGIWTSHSPGGPDYVRNLWSWTVAFLPGFVALWIGRSERGKR